MDFSPTGWVALYPDASPPMIRNVEAWHDEDGAALVVDERAGITHGSGLVRAGVLPGFRGLKKAPRLMAVTPATQGWRVELWNSRDGKERFIEPIAAWLVDDAGNLYPVNGSNDEYLSPINQRCQILPPGESQGGLSQIAEG